jgi:hypothetical protein
VPGIFAVVPRRALAQDTDFVEIIQRNRPLGRENRVVTHAGKCVYECVWIDFDGFKHRGCAAEDSNLKHLLLFFGGMLSSDIEPEDIARYQEQRRKEKAAAGTINLEVSTLRGILRRLGLWAGLQPEVRMLPERHDVGRA